MAHSFWVTLEYFALLVEPWESSLRSQLQGWGHAGWNIWLSPWELLWGTQGWWVYDFRSRDSSPYKRRRTDQRPLRIPRKICTPRVSSRRIWTPSESNDYTCSSNLQISNRKVVSHGVFMLSSDASFSSYICKQKVVVYHLSKLFLDSLDDSLVPFYCFFMRLCKLFSKDSVSMSLRKKLEFGCQLSCVILLLTRVWWEDAA